MRFLVLLSILLPLALLPAGPAAGAPLCDDPPPPALADAPQHPEAQASFPLTNAGLECGLGHAPQPGINGTVPSGWKAVLVSGYPLIMSTRYRFYWDCTEPGFVERLEGNDDWIFESQDVETPPNPGKPFDAALHQQAPATPGTIYSLSAWTVSFCGGSNSNPNDCPPGYYIRKMVGIDPAGGTDPTAPGIVWATSDANFVQERWNNLRVGAIETADHITAFVRVVSPFQHHGNHALVDGVSLVRGPVASFGALPKSTRAPFNVSWSGDIGPDIPVLPNSTHRLLFDLDYRIDGGAWTPWLRDQAAGSALYQPAVTNEPHTLTLRVRPRAEQPAGSGGMWPNQRYPGVWQVSAPIALNDEPPVPVTDQVTTPEDEPLEIHAAANDYDADGDLLSIVEVGTPAHGVALLEDDHIVYRPAADYFGPETFTYRVTDGILNGQGTVAATVTPVNDPPRILNTGWRMFEACTAVSFRPLVVDPEGDPTTLTGDGFPPGVSVDQTGLVSGRLQCGDSGLWIATLIARDRSAALNIEQPFVVVTQLHASMAPAVNGR